MTYDPENYPRSSPRLPNYDYCQPGIYCVTICVQDRNNMLGRVVDSTVRLSPVGLLAQQSWEGLPEHFPFVELDMHVIMPNHFHGLIVINELPQASDPLQKSIR
jgi:putative transposase